MFTYTSTTGNTVNVGSYVVTTTGISFSENIPVLDSQIGKNIARADDGLNTSLVIIKSPERSSIPAIVPPDGTVATDGTITLGTALQFIYPHAWVYLPTGAVVGGVAGMYYCTFTTTTVGIVNTNYVNAATTPFVPSIPTTAVAAVGSNAGYVTVVTTDHAIANVTIPAYSMGATGKVSLRATFAISTSSNAKTIKAVFGNMTPLAAVPTASLSLEVQKDVINQTSSIQVSSSAAVATGTGAAGVLIKGAVDTTADVAYIIYGQTHTTDSGAAGIVMESMTVQIIGD